MPRVMACCLMAPSCYLNQYWLITNVVLWQSTILQEALKIPIHKMSLKIMLWKLEPYFARGNELIHPSCRWTCHGSFCVWAQPMRDDVILYPRFSLAEPIHRIIPARVWYTDSDKARALFLLSVLFEWYYCFCWNRAIYLFIYYDCYLVLGH